MWNDRGGRFDRSYTMAIQQTVRGLCPSPRSELKKLYGYTSFTTFFRWRLGSQKLVAVAAKNIAVIIKLLGKKNLTKSKGKLIYQLGRAALTNGLIIYYFTRYEEYIHFVTYDSIQK